MKAAVILLALLGVAFAKRQVVLSPPPVVPSPPPPPPPTPVTPGTPPAPAPTTFPTPGFLWSLVVPGYTQATFGATQQAQLCDLLIAREVQEIAIENCKITTIATYNGTNVEVSGYTYWGWKRVPNVSEVNTANALRDYAIIQLKTNTSGLFAPTFSGVYPNCACEGVTEVTRSGNLNFEYKNISIVPASTAGPAQCGAKLSYDSTVASNVINQVGVESAVGANFGKFCAPGGVAGGIIGTPGVGTCRQYGVIATAANSAQAKVDSNPTTTGSWAGAKNSTLVVGSGYSTSPVVTVAAPSPIAITPTFALNTNQQISQAFFAASNGPYTTSPAVTVSEICFQCTSSSCGAQGYNGTAVCSGTTQSLQIGSQTYSGPTCKSSNWGVQVTDTQVSSFTVGGAVIGTAETNNVICTTTPQMTVSTNTLQRAETATATATLNSLGEVTSINLITGGSGYVFGTTPAVTISAPASNDIGKLCSPTPIAGLASDVAVSTSITITTTGQCQPLGIDTYSRKVCSVPAVRNGLSNWNKLGVQTCDTVSSFRAQPDATFTDSCLLLPQTFITSVIGPTPSPPVVPPAKPPTPPSPSALVCTYRGTYEITPLYGPCDKYYIASGTDDNCSNNLVNLRTKSNLGDKLNRIRWTFATEAKDNLGVPTQVLANARTGCAGKYLAAPANPTNLKVGGSAWKWQFVPYPGSSKCDQVNMISENRITTTAFLEVPKTCDRFRYNATDGGRQRFRLRKL